jgi:fatty acid desaturase
MPALATTMRMERERLLTPPLVHHNDHLIHHLFPTVPLYKMHDLSYLTYDGLSARTVSDLSAFGFTPAKIGLYETHSNLN